MNDPTVVTDLLRGGWRALPFEPFRDGVEICRLGGAGPDTPAQAAVLRYAPGAAVPLHEHVGVETIVVLDGAQADERGHYPAGTVVVNPPGTRHSVHAPDGCVVLITWAEPVSFVDAEAPQGRIREP